MEPIINQAKKHASAAKVVTVPKNTADLQRLKVEKLMKKPEKPVFIPDRPKDWKPKAAPEFVRDVMGSSAGAGSGEFHVYRHIRRREYTRQEFLEHDEKRQKLDAEFKSKQEENKRAAEAATAKKRAKRLRKKERRKRANGKTQNEAKEKPDSDQDSESDTEEVGPQLVINHGK